MKCPDIQTVLAQSSDRSDSHPRNAPVPPIHLDTAAMSGHLPPYRSMLLMPRMSRTAATTAPAGDPVARKRPRKPSPPLPPPRASARLYARIAPRHIAMFRFLLEAQDNLGYMTVLDRGVGGGTDGAPSCPNGPNGPVAAPSDGATERVDAVTETTVAATARKTSGTGADAVLKIVFSPHQEREMRAFLDGMRATIPFTVFESPLRTQAKPAG